MKAPPSTAPPASDSYLALQPIFDRDLRLYAFELLFRAGEGEDARVNDDHRASATVMHHVFNKLGADTVLGPHLGFINLDAAMLASSVVERLPKDKVVLEILETVEVNADLLARCVALRAAGISACAGRLLGPGRALRTAAPRGGCRSRSICTGSRQVRWSRPPAGCDAGLPGCWPRRSTARNRYNAAATWATTCSRAITLAGRG